MNQHNSIARDAVASDPARCGASVGYWLLSWCYTSCLFAEHDPHAVRRSLSSETGSSGPHCESTSSALSLSLRSQEPTRPGSNHCFASSPVPQNMRCCASIYPALTLGDRAASVRRCRHVAASKGCYALAKWLIKKQHVDVNPVDQDGRTPLAVRRAASHTNCLLMVWVLHRTRLCSTRSSCRRTCRRKVLFAARRTRSGATTWRLRLSYRRTAARCVPCCVASAAGCTSRTKGRPGSSHGGHNRADCRPTSRSSGGQKKLQMKVASGAKVRCSRCRCGVRTAT